MGRKKRLNYKSSYRSYLSYIEPELERTLVGIYPNLKDAMAYSLLSGGKRLRPVLLLASCDLSGGELRRAVPFALAVEMIHTYSLIHDDLPCMDDDDLRRGKPSNHKVFGEGMAVLAGDALLSLAFEVMGEQVCKYEDNLPLAHALLCIARYSGTGGMVSGQARDLDSTGKEITTNDLRRLHTEKTGSLMTAACVAGALIGKAEDALRKALEVYGQHLGLAYQIKDDLLDDEADEDGVGRVQKGNDSAHKPNYVSQYGREQAALWARRSANIAIEALAPFGDKAEFLRKTAVLAVKRSN